MKERGLHYIKRELVILINMKKNKTETVSTFLGQYQFYMWFLWYTMTEKIIIGRNYQKYCVEDFFIFLSYELNTCKKVYHS